MSKILLKNAAVFDVCHWNEKLDVLVDGQRIEKVQPSIQPSGAEAVYDLSGYSLLPGIIDAHVHLISGINGDDVYTDTHLKNWAKAGVCLVRDLGLGGKRPLADYIAWRNGARLDPQCCDVVSAGKYITAVGGRSHIMPDGAQTGIGCSTPEDVVAAIDLQLDSGCDGVKAMFGTRNGAGKPLPNLGPDEVKAMVDHAAERGVWVCCHVLEAEFLPMLLDAGMPELAHIPTDNVIDDATVERLVAQNVAVTPTLIANTETPPPMSSDKMPPELVELMKKMPPPDRSSQKQQDANAVENIRRFFAKGGTVALGTDTMRMETKPQPVGIPTGEMRQLIRAGLGLRDVIAAATINAARVCRMDDELGSITEGKRACIIALRSPLDETFSALEHAEFVMNRGVVLKHD